MSPEQLEAAQKMAAAIATFEKRSATVGFYTPQGYQSVSVMLESEEYGNLIHAKQYWNCVCTGVWE